MSRVRGFEATCSICLERSEMDGRAREDAEAGRETCCARCESVAEDVSAYTVMLFLADVKDAAPRAFRARLCQLVRQHFAALPEGWETSEGEGR